MVLSLVQARLQPLQRRSDEQEQREEEKQREQVEKRVILLVCIAKDKKLIAIYVQGKTYALTANQSMPDPPAEARPLPCRYALAVSSIS